ncbi:ECs1072 family phage-associated protein [Klebsiella quasivariicola]|uniref:ECs1072 family phage-associated protein n=1 Tax=Klebsiella quasivariicola TaxID=2026240 RepID=UPI000E3DFDD5|nr:hypothetical protein [Klebsiella quasivariicola]
MSVINEGFFELIRQKVFEYHSVPMSGVVGPDYEKAQNRSVLIFTLEIILEEHRKNHASLVSPLSGKQALHHLLLTKFGWTLSEIRGLSLQDSIFAITDNKFCLENLPENAQYIIKQYNAHRAKTFFPSLEDDEWDPELFLQMPKQRNW